MRTMIAAINPEGIIGADGAIPWHYRADLRRFKQLTQGHTVIMGRATFASIGRALPERTNFVVSRTLSPVPDVRVFSSLEQAVDAARGEVWFIGGRRIYEDAMDLADVIDVTWVVDAVDHPSPVRFPQITAAFAPGPVQPFPEPWRSEDRTAETLRVQRFVRRGVE